jgi:hypothetical protein
MPRGGYRPGSGPKKGTKYKKVQVVPNLTQAENPQEAADLDLTPLDYMLKIMRDTTADPARRDRMAAQAAPYVHKKAADQGAKANAKEKAEKAATGKFAPTPAPILPFKRKP